jgi:YidC/Oxa1 family membrane protein insertase
VFDLFANILAFFYAITHNYALAIALLTLCVMIVLTPLTLKGTKNMLQLQKLQPEIKRLQAEHKGDRQKLNEEMMALYKENKINPLSGCLPLLLQAPVFIILYRVLSGLTRHCSQTLTIDGQTCTPPDGFYPDYVKQSSELFKSLFGQTQMLAFGLDLSKPATKQLSEGFLNGLPYLLLVLLVAALSYYQQRQVSSRMKDNVNPQQQLIMKVIPIFFAVIALTLPAGLIVYFITSSLYRIAQQAYITRKFYRKDTPKGGDDSGNGAKKSKPTPPATPAATAKPRPATRPTPKRPAASGKRSPAPATPPKSSSPGQRPTPNRPTPRPRPNPSRPAPKKK